MDNALLLARLLLAATFGVAGVAKLADFRGSRRTLTDFGVPGSFVTPLARLLPTAELAIAVLLLPARSAWWGALGCLALLLAFVAGVGWNLARNRTPDCHCFGQLHSEPAGWRTLVRNGALAAIAAWVVWHAPMDVGPGAVEWILELTTPALIAVLAAGAGLALLAGVVWWLDQLHSQGKLLVERLVLLEKRPGAMEDPAAVAAAPASPTPVSPALSLTLERGLPVGSKAPDFRLLGLRGETLSLEGLLAAGKPAVLLFTDPQCGPCGELLSEVGRWQREYVSLTLAIVSRGQRDLNQADATVHGLRNVLLQRDREVAESYQAKATPAAVLVLADGRLGSRLGHGADAIRTLVTRAMTDQVHSRELPAELAQATPMAALALDARLRPHPAVSATSLDEDLVVYDPRSGKGHVLNATAARVWSLLDGSHTTSAVAETLAAYYDLPGERALHDVRELVRNLHGAGLVVV